MDLQAEGIELPSEQHRLLETLDLPSDTHVTIHMTHLAHLDLTWYWRLPDTLEMALETIRWHVELVEQHTDARYSHTQVLALRMVEELDPLLFARFCRMVEAGRIEIDSGQVVEPDHNLPAGESLIRQFLYGQQYLEAHFHRRALTVVNSDSFGHPRSLPQIFQQAGIRHILFKRPRQRSMDLPESPFVWEGIDGTRLTAIRFINKGAGLPSLSQYYTLPEGVTDLQEKVNRNLMSGVHHLFASHCNSDSGGSTPYLAPCEGAGYRLQYDTPSDFFAAVLADKPALPVVDKPLNYLMEGCYTTHIEEKAHCRQAERALRAVEMLWVHASLAGHGYPRQALTALWWRLCYLQFHDILPGTGSPDAHADSGACYQELLLQAQMWMRKAQIALDGEMVALTSLRAITVSNPHAHRVQDVALVDIEMPLVRGNPASAMLPLVGSLLDADGVRIPYQIVETRWRQRFVRGTMLFPVSAAPALGMFGYRLDSDESPIPASDLHACGTTLENALLRIEVGGASIIRKMTRIADGHAWLQEGDAPVRLELWPETEFHGDYGSPMQAWILGDTDAREYAVLEGEMEVVEDGPVRATIRITQHWRASRFIFDVSLYTGQPYVEIRCTLDWKEYETLARLCVQPRITGAARRSFGIPAGVENANGLEREIPSIGWADLSGDNGGIAILNRDRPGHTFREDALRVSLVRCATGDFDPRTDSGIISTTLRLLPHDGDAFAACVPQYAEEFQYPLLAWQTSNDVPGASCEPIRVIGDGILTSALKVAEDGKGYILRLWETHGEQAAVTLILTPPFQQMSIAETTIMEDAGAAIMPADGQLHLTFRPYEIKSLRFSSEIVPDCVGGERMLLFR